MAAPPSCSSARARKSSIGIVSSRSMRVASRKTSAAASRSCSVRSRPCSPARSARAKQGGHDGVKHIEGIILSTCFEGACPRQQVATRRSVGMRAIDAAQAEAA